MLKLFKMVRWIVVVIGTIGWFTCEFECAPFQIRRAPVSITDKKPEYVNTTTGCHECHVFNIFSNTNITCFVVNCSRVDANRFSESDLITKSPRSYWVTTPSSTPKYNQIDRKEEAPSMKFMEEANDENLIDQPTYEQDATQPPSHQIRLGINQTVETYQNTRTTNKTQEIYYQNIHAVDQNVETYQNTHTINQTQEINPNIRDIIRNEEARNSITNDKDINISSFDNENNDFTETTSVYQLFVEDGNNNDFIPFIVSKLITTTTMPQPEEVQPPKNPKEKVTHIPNNQVYWSRRQTTTASPDEYDQFMEMLEEDLQEYEVRAILYGNSLKYSNDSIYKYNTIYD